MDGKARAEHENEQLAARLIGRLQQDATNYEWDGNRPLFHSSYDNWHVYGQRRAKPPASSAQSTSTSASVSPIVPPRKQSADETSLSNPKSSATSPIAVVARVSRHALRLEREYRLAQELAAELGPDQDMIIKVLDFVRLPARQPGEPKLVAMIVESPGRNYLVDMVELGPGVYRTKASEPCQAENDDANLEGRPDHHKTPLGAFMSFAIGAVKCLEYLHHRKEIVHGDLRGDAFHFNKETGAVRLINFGSGARSFENGLTSAGWSALTSQLGVEHKLQFVAPEQTGRLPAEPDSRTDIYSLGILFWIMLADEPAFAGAGPLDIMQNALTKRLPSIETKRSDVPSVISRIIQKMTQRNMSDRYQSTTGLQHDLKACQKLLEDGDLQALLDFKLGTTDVSATFNQPTTLIGRQAQLETIRHVMDRALSRASERTAVTKKELLALRSLPVISHERTGNDSDHGSSVRTNSTNKELHPISAEAVAVPDGSKRRHTPARESGDITSSDLSLELRQSGSRSSTNSLDVPTVAHALSSAASMATSKESLLRTAQKLRKQGTCEVISISGAAGLGKSTIIQRIQAHARERGYYASARFDFVRRVPFEPAFKIMSSLFRQIFSENDVTTDLHQQVRALVGPVWSSLHTALELPSWLMNPSSDPKMSKDQSARQSDSSTDGTIWTSTSKDPGSTQSTADWLKGSAVARNDRFITTFLDFLRLLVMHKFLCLCLDDLQFADEESLDLINSIVASGVPIVLILTFRTTEALPPKTRLLVDHSTQIVLAPFTEKQTAEYVMATLHRSADQLLPLTAVLQQKTNGVPFMIREMLDECYRTKTIHYSWRNSRWEYDLDKIFAQFASSNGGEVGSDDYIARRLSELPTDAKTLLCWASLVGNTFTFTLMYQVITCDCSKASPMELLPTRASDAVSGLQAALASFAIMSTDEEDKFRFSHDRYLGAVKALREPFKQEEMHFVLATAMMKHDPWTPGRPTQILFDQSRHICRAIEVIRNRAASYKRFRQVLYEAAQTAREQGARQTALFYLQHSVRLVGKDVWDVGNALGDATYEEVLDIMTQIAASLWYLGDFDATNRVIEDIFEHTKTAADRSIVYVLKSRIHAQRGDSRAAFDSLQIALKDLGFETKARTVEDCDAEFQRLAPIFADHQLDLRQLSVQVPQELFTTGAVMIELLSAAFWTDPLLFYQLTLQMINLYLDKGIFPQLALGCVHLASIAIARFDMLEYGLHVGNLAKSIMNVFANESYTNGRGHTLHALFIGHIQTSMPEQLPVLQRGLEATIASGDKILQTLNLGVTSAFKLWCSHDMVDIESFIIDLEDTVPGWRLDVRGGAILLGVLQYARALQGKTGVDSAEHILNDKTHNTAEYHQYVKGKSSEPSRPLAIYDCYRLAALYRFGYHKEAWQLGESLQEPIGALFCMRYYYFGIFFFAMSLIEVIRENRVKAQETRLMERVEEVSRKLKSVGTVTDTNFAAYIAILEAQVAELEGRFDDAIKAYELAVNHTVLHGLILDEALSNELYAEFLIRRGTTRPARALLDDSITAYKRVSAHGKIAQMHEKHAFTIHRTGTQQGVEQGTQTDDINTGNSMFKLARNEEDMVSQTSEERTKAWLAPSQGHGQAEHRDSGTQDHAALSAVGLDMIDLATILESSQLLSSELDVDKLLKKLTHIIVDATGAEIGGVVIENEDHGWVIAALHEQDGVDQIGSIEVGSALDDAPDSVAQQACLYALRFRESLFVPNVLEDERFGASRDYRRDHPNGRAIIVTPILHGDNHLLGCIYNEGPARSFTARNTAVLRLLVNQISISVANALLFKRLDKASASNAAMLSMQKQALEQARESERKAKMAEAQAMEMVRLKEEAAKAKSMFLANVSHELRTPLNGVIGMSELLKASQLSKEQEGYADSIRVCADTLLSVINDILDFSKLEAGKMQLFNVQLSLKETISEVVRALSYTNIERGLRTVEELEMDSSMLVMGDPVRLHQVFMNLLSNAYKFTAKGKVTVRAVIEKEDDKMIHVMCSVTDTGIGISEEQRKKLFLPFSQADSSTARSYGGTGLGLSICKAIVEIMKGRIWLTSEPGVGTTVAFTLALQKVDKTGHAQANNNKGADPMSIYRTPANENSDQIGQDHLSLAGIPRAELKVCIAEDNPINQKIAISFVQRLGFKCEAFADGQQAVDALDAASKAGSPFHLVLMDCQMPVLDGYNATREIRKHPDLAVRNVLVIAMTASAIRGDREKCLEAGMNNYLAKPVRANVLKQMLEGYLSAGDKVVPDLQGVANGIAKKVLNGEENAAGAAKNAGENKTGEDKPAVEPTTEAAEQEKD